MSQITTTSPAILRIKTFSEFRRRQRRVARGLLRHYNYSGDDLNLARTTQPKIDRVMRQWQLDVGPDNKLKRGVPEHLKDESRNLKKLEKLVGSEDHPDHQKVAGPLNALRQAGLELSAANLKKIGRAIRCFTIDQFEVAADYVLTSLERDNAFHVAVRSLLKGSREGQRLGSPQDQTPDRIDGEVRLKRQLDILKLPEDYEVYRKLAQELTISGYELTQANVETFGLVVSTFSVAECRELFDCLVFRLNQDEELEPSLYLARCLEAIALKLGGFIAAYESFCRPRLPALALSTRSATANYSLDMMDIRGDAARFRYFWKTLLKYFEAHFRGNNVRLSEFLAYLPDSVDLERFYQLHTKLCQDRRHDRADCEW